MDLPGSRCYNLSADQADKYLRLYFQHHGKRDLYEANSLRGIKGYARDRHNDKEVLWAEEGASRALAAHRINQAFAVGSLSGQANFTDLCPQDLYYEDMVSMDQANLMGRGSQEFRPQDPITRAEIISVLNRVKAYEVKGTDRVPFGDMGPDHWAYEEVSYAWQRGLVSGYPDGSFQPEKAISVDELLVFIDRYQKAS